MTELKAFNMPRYAGEFTMHEVYLKSEVDKKIAELKKEIEEQKRLRDMALASVPNVLKVMKIIQHQKRKRCLAMADYCKAQYDYEDRCVNGCGLSWEYISPEMKYWERWQWRWEELAEEPTWARFLQLIRKETK